MTLPRFGIRVHGGLRPQTCVTLAQAADAAGFASVWFAENAFARGILPAATACALATTSIQIGAGVFNPFSRHPTMMAMEIGALDELAEGRATLSIGAGIIAAAGKMGLDASKPLPAVRDALIIVRRLLAGDEVDHEGTAFSARKIRLDYQPRRDIPIFIAGRGNLMVKLAGESADGLIVSNMCSVAFAQRIAGAMENARRAAGRTGRGKVVQYMPCCVDDDRATAIAAGKRAVGEMVPGFWALAQKLDSAKEGLLAGTGITDEEFASAATRLRAGEDAADVLDERFTDAFSLSGTAQDCISGARRYAQAGITELALTFSGANAVAQIAMLGHAAQNSC